MLFDSERHFALRNEEWSETEARTFAREVYEKSVHAFAGATMLWPGHPLDAEGSDIGPFTEPYLGASGGAWFLDHLSSRMGWKCDLSASQVAKAAHEAWRAKGGTTPSYFLGTTGFEIVSQITEHKDFDFTVLGKSLRELAKTPANEILYGAPGGLLAACLLYERIPHPELKSPLRELIDSTLATWDHSLPDGAMLWEQNLGNANRVFLGAAHGTAGNVFALLKARKHLTPEEFDLVCARGTEFVKSTAVRAGGLANWPALATSHSPNNKMLLHWCHGAPGIVTSFAELMGAGTGARTGATSASIGASVGVPTPGARTRDNVDAELDELLLAAGELIWKAGALHKGPSLCHGTAGNGAALLKLYERTGDVVWLERARAMAMTAIAQSRELEAHHGQLRYSLWTGDWGVSLFALDCIIGQCRLPLIDTI